MNSHMDIREIMEILPHRYPFLLVDRIVELEDRKRVVAIKNVTMNEPYFMGHFPGVPVMPGVLQCEAMAQAAGIMMLNRLKGTGKLAFLMSMNHVKFRKPVVPGDQLIITAEAIRDRGSIGTVSAKVEVDGKVVSEAEITFSIADRA
ncbi:MAG: 3-hydroxyacyl-ACP dehydratase FabZ [Planctomycetota bacterium]